MRRAEDVLQSIQDLLKGFSELNVPKR